MAKIATMIPAGIDAIVRIGRNATTVEPDSAQASIAASVNPDQRITEWLA